MMTSHQNIQPLKINKTISDRSKQCFRSESFSFRQNIGIKSHLFYFNPIRSLQQFLIQSFCWGKVRITSWIVFGLSLSSSFNLFLSVICSSNTQFLTSLVSLPPSSRQSPHWQKWPSFHRVVISCMNQLQGIPMSLNLVLSDSSGLTKCCLHFPGCVCRRPGCSELDLKHSSDRPPLSWLHLNNHTQLIRH